MKRFIIQKVSSFVALIVERPLAVLLNLLTEREVWLNIVTLKKCKTSYMEIWYVQVTYNFATSCQGEANSPMCCIPAEFNWCWCVDKYCCALLFRFWCWTKSECQKRNFADDCSNYVPLQCWTSTIHAAGLDLLRLTIVSAEITLHAGIMCLDGFHVWRNHYGRWAAWLRR